MTTESVISLESKPIVADRVGLGWLMPSLSLLLAGMAAAEFLFFIPKTIYVVQQLSGRPPGYLNLLSEIPAWLAVVTAATFAIVVIRQRSSLRKSALLASVAIATNIGLIFCMLGGLFEILSRV